MKKIKELIYIRSFEAMIWCDKHPFLKMILFEVAQFLFEKWLESL
ncbi:hypothetical protein NSS98_25125 [Paenibacillus sp. FSL E2-0274]|nr:hypothetical protein [Paenibacillus odorifer]